MTIKQQRTVLIISSLIVTMALLEITLRAAGIVYAHYRIGGTEEIAEKKDKSSTKILCLGDSFTFGVGTVKGFSYPEQLQKMLDSDSGRKYSVYNAGIGGQNSSHVLKDLESNVYKYRPDIVIILIGGNNNNFVDSNYFLFKDKSSKTHFYRMDAFLSHMRIYKLFRSAVVTVCGNIGRKADVYNKNRLFEPQKDKNTVKDVSSEFKKEAEKHVEAAKAYYAESKVDSAISECKKAIDLNPYDYNAYYLLGFICLHRRPYSDEKINLRLAIENSKKAIRINPLDEAFYENLFNAYYRIGEKDKAMEELRMIHALNPANEMVNALLTYGLPDYSDMNVFKMTLVYDLRNIISLLSASNIKLILQSYPASWANDILKETAKVNRIVFVDNQAVFKAKQAMPGYKREYYFAADGHCNAEGYKIMAENIYNMIKFLK